MREICVGVDVGYGNTKSRRSVFGSGVKKLPVKPALDTGCVKWQGEYYIVGGEKNSIQKSKVESEDTRVLTLAALGEELRIRHLTEAKVRLGIGLPLTRMGAEKEAYLSYMNEYRNLDFQYEGRTYHVQLLSVDVFPQGYAGVAGKLSEFSGSTVIADVGSWTVDLLPLQKGRPDLSKCKSIPIGTMTCKQEMNEQLRQKLGAEVEENMLLEVMLRGTADMDHRYLSVIQEGLRTYAGEIMDELRSLKINTDLTQVIFIGGGASVLKNFGREEGKIQVIEDVQINAKGYEDLLRHKYRMEA